MGTAAAANATFLSSFPTFFTSQINYLHPSLCLKVCFCGSLRQRGDRGSEKLRGSCEGTRPGSGGPRVPTTADGPRPRLSSWPVLDARYALPSVVLFVVSGICPLLCNQSREAIFTEKENAFSFSLLMNIPNPDLLASPLDLHATSTSGWETAEGPMGGTCDAHCGQAGEAISAQQHSPGSSPEPGTAKKKAN